MRLSLSSRKGAGTGLLIMLLLSLSAHLAIVESFGSPQQPDSYHYRFLVDEDGSALVRINYTSEKTFGYSWVIVPKFLELTNHTQNGRILNFTYSSTRGRVDIEYYFYRVLDFSFQSDGHFEMILQFNFTSAAMIIEPNGVFFSPQIGFKSDSVGSAEVIFPSNFQTKSAVAGPRYLPTFTNSNYVRFDDLPSNTLRLQIEFEVRDGQPDLLRIEDGVFTFKTVQRYENYARDILSLFNRTYDDLVDIFNTTLKDVNVEFFVPDFEYLLSIGGYVPFTGEEMGNIHVNIFYTRYVKGYIETIALHELVHHFLWRVGVSPQDLLWFHEGMAEYVSIELATNMGYEGASMMKQELEYGITVDSGNNLGFLLSWTPSHQPTDWGSLYTAAYFVVTRLSEHYGGLNYYARFFDLLGGVRVEDSSELAYYLGLAANMTVVPRLRSWGLNLADLYEYSSLIVEAQRSILRVNPIFQPYKFLAEQLYRLALMNAEQDNVDIANISLLAAVLVAELAPLLALITISAFLFSAIFYGLKRKGLFSNRPL